MSGLLQWRVATVGDRQALKMFECTKRPQRRKVPPYGFEHDNPWELAVEKQLRNSEPPCHMPWTLWVGEDEQGLGGAVMAEELDGPGSVFLCLMAVAYHHRYQGGGYGDDLVDFVLDELVDRAIRTELDEVSIEARIHKENHASQSLARRSQFRHVDWADDELQVWAAVIPLPRRDDFAAPSAPITGVRC